MDEKTPFQLIEEIRGQAQSMPNGKEKENLIETANTIAYLLTLLEHCAEYIQDYNETGIPPRLYHAVKEAVKKT